MKRVCSAGLAGILLLLINSVLVAQQTVPGVIEPLPIGVAFHKTTNLIFPYAIKSVDRGSSTVLVQKAKGVENILQVKAGKVQFEPTNLSIVTADGAFYSFLLEYATEPSVLNFQLPATNITYPALLDGVASEKALEEEAEAVQDSPAFLRLRRKQQQVRMWLPGIYLTPERMWLDLQVSNQSQINFQPEYVRFIIRDAKKIKKTAIQSKELLPVHIRMDSIITGQSRGLITAGFEPFTVPRNQQLIIQIGETNGRILELPVKSKTVLKARRL